MARPEQILFRFVKSPEHREVPVNGVWGGPTIRGDIRVDWFYEYQATPAEVVQKVTEAGTLADPVLPGPAEHVRTIMVTMMLTPEQADSIGDWLKQKAQLLKLSKGSPNVSDRADH